MISIALCTFNRAASLHQTLASLVDALRGVEQTEVIVIDNNSTDATRATCDGFMSALPSRYVFEPIQGLSAARNRALREFRGTHLVFTDDDVLVDSHWVRACQRAIAEHPSAGFFGGRVVPFYPAGKPSWLKDESLALIDGLLVRYHLGETNRLLNAADPTPFGANFALSRNCIDRVGKFRVDLGVKGGVPGRGEEADYMERAIAMGETGVYVGEAVVNHSTDPRRLTLPYLYRYGIQKGVAAKRMGSDRTGGRAQALTFFARGILQLLKGRGDRMRQCIINAGIEQGLRLESGANQANKK
jgi:glucosyl-dolichyl phosphate glucuronosyltransferase